MQVAETGAQPSFAKASFGFLTSTTLLSIAMVLLGSL
jgi:hypothetical protein